MAIGVQTEPKAATEANFGGLLSAQIPTLRGLARRYTRNDTQAEDLLQDTVVKALTFQDRFVSGTNFAAWIRTVMTNTFLNRYRRNKLEKAALTTHQRYDVMRNLRSEATRRQTREPEKELLVNSLDDAMTGALAGLAPQFRAAIELCDLGGVSYKEASARLGCPIGTVMSRLHRGRRELRRALGAALPAVNASSPAR